MALGTVPVMTDVATATITSDLNRAKADLVALGYCLLEGVMTTDGAAAVRRRIADLAEA